MDCSMPRTNSAVLGFSSTRGPISSSKLSSSFFGAGFFGSSGCSSTPSAISLRRICPVRVWASSCGSSSKVSPLAGSSCTGAALGAGFLRRGGRAAFSSCRNDWVLSGAGSSPSCMVKPVVACGAGAGCGCTVSFGVMTGSPTGSASRRGAGRVNGMVRSRSLRGVNSTVSRFLFLR